MMIKPPTLFRPLKNKPEFLHRGTEINITRQLTVGHVQIIARTNRGLFSFADRV